ALAVAPDDRSLLVTSGWGQALSVLDADDGMRVSFQVPLAREPRAVTVSEDGSVAYVAHVVGSRLSAIDLRAPEHPVRTIDVSGRDAGFARRRRLPFQQAKASALPGGQAGGRLGCQGYALARSVEPSGRIFVPQVLVDPGNSEQPSGGYGDGQTAAEVASVGVIDETNGAVLPASLQLTPGDTQMNGQPGRECLLPRAAAVNSSTHSLFVACLGADAVIEYDAAAANPRSAEKRRWSLPAGPTGVAVDQLGQRLAVWSQFDQSLSIVQLSGDSGRPVTLALSRKARSATEGDLALGRKLFHATGNMGIAQDGRSCASCHPDGRDDSLTWSTPDGPRNTPMLAGRLQQTGPFGWNGTSDSVSDHLQQTFQRLRGQGLQPHEVAALDAFVHGMRTPAARVPMTGSASAQRVARGKEVFESAEAGCASCHTGGGSVDGTKHDVTSQARADRETTFDTPTLRFVSGTAPYFHDGRYETLRDMLQGHDGKMGHTGHLAASDLDALEAYLRTL
ncbi:MAG: c-type cytochrome, partial [Myxococcales bacterium]